MSNHHMADVSDAQATFNAAAYRAAGHRVVALKATEGLGFEAHGYAARVLAAHRAGLHVIHYHFAHPDHHDAGGDEARELLRVAQPHWRRGDRLSLDLEVDPHRTTGALLDYVGDFLAVWQRAGHHYPWLYTFTSYLDDRLAGQTPDGWRLWLADFRKMSRLEKWRRHVWAHQFTDGLVGPEPHAMAGIGRVDVSWVSRRAYSALLK